MTKSSEPFFCQLCTLRKQQGVILELQENVGTLSAEVFQLKIVVEALLKEQEATVNAKSNMVSTRDCVSPWNVVAAKKKDNKGKGKGLVHALMSESSRSKNTTPGLKYSDSKKPLRACVK